MGMVAAHQSAIVATGIVAGTVSQVESATLNGVALGKEAKAAVQASGK